MASDYLVRHKTGWRYKRVIPLPLQPVIGAKRWSKYLAVRTRREAQITSAAMRADHDQQIEMARRLSPANRQVLIDLLPDGTLDQRLALLSDQEHVASFPLPFLKATVIDAPIDPDDTIDDDGGELDLIEELRARRDAKAGLEKAEKQLKAVGQIRKQATRPAQDDIVETMLAAWLRKSGSRNHKVRKARLRALKQFFKFAGVDCPADVTKAHVRRFRDHLDQRQEAGEINHQSARSGLSELSVVFSAAIDYGVFDGPNPFSDVSVSAAPVVKFAERKQPRRAWDPEHVTKVWAVIDAKLARWQRAKTTPTKIERVERALDTAAIWRLLAYHGMRSGELLQMRIADVRTEHDVLLLNLTDAGEEQSLKSYDSLRPVPVHVDCVPIVEDLLERARGFPSKHMLFTSYADLKSPANVFQEAAHRLIRDTAKIKDESIVTHGLRHRWRCLARDLTMPESVSRAVLAQKATSTTPHTRERDRT
jgi:integrase